MTAVTQLLAERGDRGRLLGAIGLGALASACGVALMGTSAWLLSRAAEHPPVLFLMVAIVAVRAFGLGKGAFRYAERLVGHDLALRLQAALRIETYRALLRSTWVGRRSGDLLSRVVNDVEAVQDVVVRAVVPMASAGLVAVATVTVLTVLSPAAGVAVGASVLIAGVLVPLPLAGRRTRRRGRSHRCAESWPAWRPRSPRRRPDLLAYGAGPRSLERLAAVDARLRRTEVDIAWSSGLAAAAQVLAAAFAVIAALLIGGRQVATGALPPIQLAVLVLTPLALHEVLTTLPAAALALTRSGAALGRVRELLDAPVVGTPDRAKIAPEALLEGAGRVESSGLTVGWPGSNPVIAGLDLTVSPGERVALVGPERIRQDHDRGDDHGPAATGGRLRRG